MNKNTIPLPFGTLFGNYMVIGTRQPKVNKILCRCKCGTLKEVTIVQLLSGHSKSCGCRKAEATASWNRVNKVKHGMVDSKEYFSWRSMKRRCYEIKNIGYKYYGARGITVCDRWLHSFENFFADMGAIPGPGYTLDKIDNDKGYSPENCRWATKMQQTHNRRGKYGKQD